MSEIRFKNNGGNPTLQIDGGQANRILDYLRYYVYDSSTVVVVLEDRQVYVSKQLNRIFINDVEVTANAADAIGQQLESDVFTAGGAASPTLPILAAPNDTQWVLTITNTGALDTQQLVNTVGASALTSVTLTAPDNAQWSVTVNNSGALVTTVI